MSEPTNGEVRAWARENGHIVADRGRIPASVMAAYAAASQKVHSPDDRAHRSDDEAIWSPVNDVDEDEDDVDDEDEDEDEQERAVDLDPPRFQRPWAAASPGAPADPAPAAWGSRSGSPPPPPAWGPPAGGAPPAWGRGAGPAAPPPPPPPPLPTGRESAALPALLLGIFPIFGGIPAIVLGAISLTKIRRTNQSGRGMAIAGIVLGTLWILVFFGIGVASGLRDADREAVPAASAPDVASLLRLGTVSADDLRLGDCPTAVPDGTVRTVKLGSCSQPHMAEVYAVFDVPGGPYPGDTELSRLAEGGCLDRLTTFVGAAREPAFDAFYLVPLKSSWDRGERDVQCILTTEDRSPLPSGSAKAA